MLSLVFVTGFTALVYEVVWQRYLGNLLGSEAKATSFILATFLGGLSLGYHVFGKTSRKLGRRSLVKLTGWLEVGIGLWAFFFAQLFQIFFTKVGVIPPEHPLSILWEFSVAAMLIGLPTVFMGGTLPLLTQALSLDLDDSSPLHASIYASNTGGAFFGCLAAGFVLLPLYGLPLTLMSIAPLNLLAGFSLILIGARGTVLGEDVGPGAQPPGRAGSASTPPGVLFVAASFLAGFVSLTLQALVIRLVGISAGSSEYAFSMIVSVFLLMLALGARKLATQRVITTRLWTNQLAAAAGLLLILFTAPNWPYVSHVVRTLLSSQGPAFYLYHLVLLVLCGAVLFLAVAAMGRTMPLLFHTYRTGLDDLGQDVGTLYTWNTLGCLAGALIGGYAAFYAFNLEGILKICAVLLLATVPMACLMEQRTLQSPKVLGSVSLALVVMVALPAWPDEKLAVGTFRLREATPSSYMGPKEFYRHGFLAEGWRLVMRVDDPNTSVAVVEFKLNQAPEKGPGFYRSLYVNGKSDGSTAGPDSGTMKLLGHLPMLFQGEEAQRVGVIGFGLGLTVGSVLLYPNVESVHVFEISPGVRQTAKYFDIANGGASQNKKLAWKMGDAYRYLVSSTSKYSVIISGPSNPWVVGVERLYTEEFYRLSRSNMTDSGMYAQWIQAYEMRPETIGMMVNTFSRVFRHLKLFSVGSDLILLGSVRPFDDRQVELMRSRLAVKAIGDDLKLAGFASVLNIFDAEVPVSLETFGDLAVHTLQNPKLSYQAGRDYFTAKHTPFRAFLKEPARRVWTQSAERRSMAYSYLRALDPPGTQGLMEVARAGCRRELVEMFAGWRESEYLCRQSLLRLALSGAIRAETKEDAQLIRVIRGLSEDAGPSGDVGDARRAIVYFTEFASPLLPLKLESLQRQAAPCFGGDSPEAIGCRTLLVQAYCYLGLTKEAGDVFGGLAKLPPEKMSDIQKAQLVDLITASVRAEKNL